MALNLDLECIELVIDEKTAEDVIETSVKHEVIDDLSIMNNLISDVSKQLAKRKKEGLDDKIIELKNLMSKFDGVLNLSHKSMMSALAHGSDILDFYEYLKKNDFKFENHKFGNGKIQYLKISDSVYDDLKDLIMKSKNKSILIPEDDFFDKYKLNDDNFAYFKAGIKGRFRVYKFIIDGIKNIEFYDFFSYSRIKIMLEGDKCTSFNYE